MMETQSRAGAWKWAFIGLFIAVVLIGCSLGAMWYINGIQRNFNQKVAANAASTNTQIRALQEETENIEDDMDTVMQAINDLDFWISEDQGRQDEILEDLQRQMNNLQSQLSSVNSRITSLWSYYYELDDRVSILECDVYAENNCTAPDICSSCSQDDGCGSCGSCGSWCDRYGCYCSDCGRPCGCP